MSSLRKLGRMSATGAPDSLKRAVVFLGVLAVGVALFLGDPLVGVGVLFVLFAAITLLSAFEVVEAYERRPLTIFGEYRRVLEPGLHVIPPFVSRTYPFDMRTQTLD
ncbi:MAG: SPFH domain-containing protein, partial [Haloferacaceae archaeon]